MAPSSLLTNPDIFAKIQHFEAHGPTDEEKFAFSAGVMLTLSSVDVSGVGGGSGDSSFEENLTRVAESVVAIDRAFDEIETTFKNLVLTLIVFMPLVYDLMSYYNDWRDLRTRWKSQLEISSFVASDTIRVLQRFDTVYLQKVESTQTERDRLDAIQALGEFINERQDQSERMSQGFLDLKREIAHLLKKFDQWLADRGFVPSYDARKYKAQIDTFQQEILSLANQIKSAKGALAIGGTSLYFFDFKDPTVSEVIYMYQMQRREKENRLRGVQQLLAGLEQQPIMGLKAKMDIWKPDVELLCEGLVLFAEIWSSVRSQAVQFRGHIQGGLDAATNMRFLREVRLARLVCTPLIAGLERYVANSESTSRKLFKSHPSHVEIWG